MTDIKIIEKLAKKYADVCKFKSDFPHDFKSVVDGYIEGFKAAEILLNKSQNETIYKNNSLYDLDGKTIKVKFKISKKIPKIILDFDE